MKYALPFLALLVSCLAAYSSFADDQFSWHGGDRGFGHHDGGGWRDGGWRPGPRHPGPWQPGPWQPGPPPPPPAPYYPPSYPSYPPPPPPTWGGSPVTCVAQDAGWEEHFGGHASCGDCLRVHGQCVQVCSSNTYVCHAQGMDAYGTSTFDGLSNISQYDASNQALSRCYQSGARNCTVNALCDTNQQVVSRNSCY